MVRNTPPSPTLTLDALDAMARMRVAVMTTRTAQMIHERLGLSLPEAERRAVHVLVAMEGDGHDCTNRDLIERYLDHAMR